MKDYTAEQMPGASGFTICVFEANDVPVGTKVTTMDSFPNAGKLVEIIRKTGYCTFGQACEIAEEIIQEWKGVSSETT